MGEHRPPTGPPFVLRSWHYGIKRSAPYETLEDAWHASRMMEDDCSGSTDSIVMPGGRVLERKDIDNLRLAVGEMDG